MEGAGEEESRQYKGPKRGRCCQQQGNGALGPTYASNWIWPRTWMCLQVDSCAGPPEKTPTWGQMGVGPWAPGAETPSTLGTSDLQNCELVELLTSSRHLCDVQRATWRNSHTKNAQKKGPEEENLKYYQQVISALEGSFHCVLIQQEWVPFEFRTKDVFKEQNKMKV